MPWALLLLVPPALVSAYVVRRWARATGPGVKPHATLEEHMAWEEATLGPTLPPATREWLLEAHRYLAKQGDPPELVKRHAVAEEARLRPHISDADFAQLQADHAYLTAEL